MRKIIILFFIIFSLAQAHANQEKSVIDINKPICYQVYDPYENFNRKMFWINDTLDNTMLKPLAKVYNKTVPSWGKTRIRSFFTNLSAPLTFINNLLQGNPNEAAKTFFRFFVNTTFGIAGTMDFAKDFGLYQNPQSFGDTFTHYGANYSAYLVLPIIGPTSVRNAAGIPFDILLNPVRYAADDTFLWIAYGGERFTARAEYLGLSASLQASSLDYYAQIRSMYLQYIAKRNPLCKNQQPIDYSIYNDYEE